MNIRNLLSISGLNVFLKEKKIINDLNLKILPGETHVIVGPNGVGKSTLAKILAGNFSLYKIFGSIEFDGVDLLSLSVSDIALKGLFLSFQTPLEIPGVSNIDFFKAFLNNKRKKEKLDPIDNVDFLNKVSLFSSKLGIDDSLLKRSVNVDFSGGEKKKNEILQMLLLEPIFIVLDEIDSGLDIDSLKRVFEAITFFKDVKKSFLIITHYCRIVNYIDIDFVHVMYNGTFVKSGNKNLLYDVDKYGYSIYGI